jgi:hypothetical protein
MKPFPMEYSYRKKCPTQTCHIIYAGHKFSAIVVHQAAFFRPDAQNCLRERKFLQYLSYSRIKLVWGTLVEVLPIKFSGV